jgi:DNA-binding response OmpR family regulator
MIKIMHVDDEEDVLGLVSAVLEKRGYNVISVSDGHACLERLNKEKVDLVLLDVMMPDISGWEVYKRIREMNKKIKIAFLSVVQISGERKRRLFEEGVSDYILKPFDTEDLVKRVKQIVDR